MPKIYKRYCNICNKPYKGQGIRYCSQECAKKRIPWNKGKLAGKYFKCKVCEKEFYVRPSCLKRNKQCCSYQCSRQFFTIWNKGLTKETDERVAKYSKKVSTWNKEHPNKFWLGKKRLDISGEKHWFWKGGVTPLDKLLRVSVEYKQWRRDVFIRDHYTCQKCGHRFIKIVAHHIKPWRDYLLLRFDVNNGKTLCNSCHSRLELKLREVKKNANYSYPSS